MSDVSVVTGASDGLGHCIALELAREGYDLALVGRDAERLLKTADEAWSLWSVQARVLAYDLRSKSHAVGDIIRGMNPSVLVNNAAYPQTLAPACDLDLSELEKTMAVNLTAPLALMQSVIPGMIERGSGVIVNICSLAGRRGIKNASLYSASKFALRGLTESIAQELDGTGVRCFSCSPGGMNTPMRQGLFGDADKQQLPNLVASLIVSAITGQLEVPQGEDLVIRGGEHTVVPRERWVGVSRELIG